MLQDFIHQLLSLPTHLMSLTGLWMSRAGLLLPFLLLFLIFVFLIRLIAIRKGEQFLSLIHGLLHFLKLKIAKNRRFRSWSGKHPDFVSLINQRLDKTVFIGRPLSILIIAFLYVTALFAGIIEDFINADAIVMADIRIAYLFYLFRSDALTVFFTWITLLGKLEIISIVLMSSVILLFIWNKKHFIFPFLVSALGSLSFTWLGKLAFQRARPEYAVYLENSFSFPSGHASIAVAIYGFIGYLFIRSTSVWAKQVNIFILTTLTALLIQGEIVNVL